MGQAFGIQGGGETCYSLSSFVLRRRNLNKGYGRSPANMDLTGLGKGVRDRRKRVAT